MGTSEKEHVRCMQERTLGAFGAAIGSMQKSMVKIEEGQGTLVSYMEKLVSHGEKIHHLEGDTNVLFERVRKIEIHNANQSGTIAAVAAIVSIVASIVGTIVAKKLGG